MQHIGSLAPRLFAAAALCAAAIACAGSQQAAGVTPVITTFIADSTTISLGQTTTLSWVVTGATALSIDNGVGDVTGTTSTAVKPEATVTYTLTASRGTASVTRSVGITVGPAPAISIYPSSGYVKVGGQFSLLVTPSTPVKWTIDEASGCGSVNEAGVFAAPGATAICHTTATPATGAAAHATIRVIADTPGQWTDISPPVDHTFQPLVNYGMQALDGAVADAPKTVYVGTCGYGIWKTLDGGDTWTQISTGSNGTQLGSGKNGSARNWSLRVDPTDSKTLYTVSGFGAGGLWKSTNGGVDWNQMLPSATTAITTNDVTNVAIDPTNHLHLLVASHSNWPNYQDSGIIESLDGGVTWTPHPPPARASGAPASQSWGTGPVIVFLGQDDHGNPSGSHWLLGGQFGAGLWRTADSGAHWTSVSSLDRSHAGFGLYRSGDGTLYLGVNNQLARSTDNGLTFVDSHAPTGQDAYAGIVGDGTTIWAMLSNTGVGTAGPYHWSVSQESDGTHWTQYNSQTFIDGPSGMLYDRVNRVLYATQWATGLWRLKLP